MIAGGGTRTFTGFEEPSLIQLLSAGFSVAATMEGLRGNGGMMVDGLSACLSHIVAGSLILDMAMGGAGAMEAAEKSNS
jgi:hypothetical protein